MRVLFLPRDGEPFFAHISARYRGDVYKRVVPLPVDAVRRDDPAAVRSQSQVYRWTQQVKRLDGTVAFDVFEEVAGHPVTPEGG